MNNVIVMVVVFGIGHWALGTPLLHTHLTHPRECLQVLETKRHAGKVMILALDRLHLILHYTNYLLFLQLTLPKLII